MNKKTIDDLNVKNKTVLLRLDLNVPLKGKTITSTKRITAAIPTIQKLIKSNAKIVIFSHLGRVKTEADKKTNSLAPVAKKLESLLKHKVKFINQTRGSKLEKAIKALMPKEIILVENTRFEDVKDNVEVKYESKNNPELGKYWASLGDIFINDAFGTAHRAHASNVGIATYIKESAVGYLMEKEVSMLSRAINNPKKPVISILGGAKVSDKIEVIKNLLKISDKVIIGGGMSYTFSSALGYKIGNSLFEADKVSLAKELLKKHKNKLVLPVDYAISKKFENAKRIETKDENIPVGWEGMDIGPKTIKLFSATLKGAKTVVWNGPMGVFEFSNFAKGTKEIAKAIAKLQGVFSIIGGGDSASAAIKLGFEKKFSYISTGGGASLEFLEGKKLPGVEAIQNKPKVKTKSKK